MAATVVREPPVTLYCPLFVVAVIGAVAYETFALELHEATAELPAPRVLLLTLRLAANAVTTPNTTTPALTGSRYFFTLYSSSRPSVCAASDVCFGRLRSLWMTRVDQMGESLGTNSIGLTD